MKKIRVKKVCRTCCKSLNIIKDFRIHKPSGFVLNKCRACECEESRINNLKRKLQNNLKNS